MPKNNEVEHLFKTLQHFYLWIYPYEPSLDLGEIRMRIFKYLYLHPEVVKEQESMHIKFKTALENLIKLHKKHVGLDGAWDEELQKAEELLKSENE